MKPAYADIFQDPSWMHVSRAKGWGDMVEFGVGFDEGGPLITSRAYLNSSKLFGKYLYFQHGPLIDLSLLKVSSEKSPAESWGEANLTDEGINLLRELNQNIEDYAAKEQVFAIIQEPIATVSSDIHKELINRGYMQQQWSILPRYPMFIDLMKSEDELMEGLEKKTRYNIRYAKKNGVVINFYHPDHPDIIQHVEDFYQIISKNADNKGYDLPHKDFFLAAIDAYKDANNICIATAEYEGKVISANYTQFFADWAGSYYTGNSRSFPKLKASYLLKWETILGAKRRGAKVFDMWGVKRPNLPKDHPEYGYGRFKLGFSPIEKTFSGRLILPLNKIKTSAWLMAGKLRNLR